MFLEHTQPFVGVPDDIPHFIGRDSLLIELREELFATSNHRVALYGLGGIGKTQTATQFVYRYKSQYNRIFWVNAATPLAFADGFRKIAAETACIPTEAIAKWSAPELVRGVTSWIEKQWRWLLVIDNLDDVFTLEGITLPEPMSNDISLLTTRNSITSGMNAHGLKVTLLDPEDAIALLLLESGVTAHDELEGESLRSRRSKNCQNAWLFPLSNSSSCGIHSRSITECVHILKGLSTWRCKTALPSPRG